MEYFQRRVIFVGCVVSVFSLLAACGGNNDSASDQGDPNDTSYSISGTVTGLTGSGLVLQNNGADDLTIDADGGFSFATPMRFGSSYAVTIAAQPGEQSCSLINGSGTVRGDVTGIRIGCPYPVPVLSVTSGGPKLLSFSWTDLGADHYRLLKNPDGISGYTQIGDDITETRLDEELAVHLTDWVNADYLLQACDGVGSCVESTPIGVASQMLDTIGYIKASNTAFVAYFGYSVALSADGATMAVGAPGDSSMSRGIDGDQMVDDPSSSPSIRSGAVYLFMRDSGGWRQQAFIKASNADAGDSFGSNVAISDDGDILAIGAPGERSASTGIDGNQEDNSIDGAGAVYIFVRTGDSWRQQAYIKASNTDANDAFGTSLALSGDGGILAVGAPTEDSATDVIDGDQLDASAEDAGSVYLFERTTGDSWLQQAYLKASNSDAGDNFGLRLAVAGDGEQVAVGAIYEDSAAVGTDGDQSDNSVSDAGAVYVFTKNGDGWSQAAYLKAPAAMAGNGFGSGLAFSHQGEWLAIGALGGRVTISTIEGDKTDTSIYNAEGAVYVFQRADGGWRQDAHIAFPENGIEQNSCAASGPGFGGSYLGGSVSLSDDGTLLAVGALGEDSSAVGINGEYDSYPVTDAGAVYLFERDDAGWSQRAYVKAPHSDKDTYEHHIPNCRLGYDNLFGGSIRLSGDGETLVVGASTEDSSATGIGGDQVNNSSWGSGAVYLY